MNDHLDITGTPRGQVDSHWTTNLSAVWDQIKRGFNSIQESMSVLKLCGGLKRHSMSTTVTFPEAKPQCFSLERIICSPNNPEVW